MGQEARMAYGAQDSSVAVRGWGLLTGWGTGLQSLPTSPIVAAQGQRLLPVTTPVLDSERLRRATRECLLGVAAVQAALDDSRLTRHEVAGARTALVYASASSYAAANWAFVTSATEQALHFPYTAPSAVPAEVTIQFGITGPYLTLLSGANAGIEAIWQAATLLTMAQCDRVLVLAVETFQDCAELYTTGRWLLGTPLLESASCLILERHPGLAAVRYRAAWGTHGLASLVEGEREEALAHVYLCTPTARAGQMAEQYLHAQWPDISLASVYERCGVCLACAPIIALMLAVAAGKPADVLLLSQWWDAWAMVRWPGGLSQARR
ncbi:MAG TPA: beta-ketoacyl synthase N-terminal-like domain-containing protein [Candidatus Tectomicrobia bacterium]